MSFYRFETGGIGIYEAVDRNCPRDDNRRSEKPDGSWLPKVGAKFPGGISFWTEIGLKQYFSSGLFNWHHQVTPTPITVVIADDIKEIAYRDEFQIIASKSFAGSGDIKSCRIARIVSPWTASYPEALIVCAGQKLALGRTDEEWPFIWCTDSFGKSGWIPLSLIEKVADSVGICRAGYSTRELDVVSGELVMLESSESGWSWVTNQLVASGWVPDKCLSL